MVTAPIIVPVGVLCAIAVRLDSPGPVFFRQVRVGLNGKAFAIWKFRTMSHGADANPVFPEKARITRTGRLLRRTSIDELPQLFNVLRGEMSLVGPRPTLPYQVERYVSRSSGILAEAICAGVPTLVPHGTWLADQVWRHGAGIVYDTLNPDGPASGVSEALACLDTLKARAEFRRAAYANFHRPARLAEFVCGADAIRAVSQPCLA